ncbi:hypothetical protein, partial [Roseibium sp. RKSG952]|uniref:hypothetical protein n=1 Tax=Roseibium sp. RKSG952 TaxID=2529384 RepID=UPI0018AD2077
VLSDLTLELDPNGIGGNGGDVLRMSWAKNGKSGYAEFADGTVLSAIEVDAWSYGRDILRGTSGDDIIVGSSE